MGHEPDQDQIDYWLNGPRERIEDDWAHFLGGFYEREGIPIQAFYTGLGSEYAALGRAKHLNGEPIDEVRECFTEAARHVLKSFRMAYDPSDPDYLGDQANYANVTELDFFDGAYWALMAADRALAAELAGWFRDPPDGDIEPSEVNGYAHALAMLMRRETQQARERLRVLTDLFARKPVKGGGWRLNFHSLFVALHGIGEGDVARFNEGLKQQLAFYDREFAHGEDQNTPKEYICDEAVALANLGIGYGLSVTIQHDLLPPGLLVPLG